MLTYYYKDSPLHLTLTIIVYEIFILRSEYSFAISLLKTLLLIKNDCQYSLSEPIGGEWEIDEKK